MDKKSWESRSAYSAFITADIEAGLRQLFSRCDVTLLMVGSLSSRLGKSLNARPEAEDSLQEYRFTKPVLGTDADFMVVLQVPVAPTEVGSEALSARILHDCGDYYHTVDTGLSMPRRFSSTSSPRVADLDGHLLSFTASPDWRPSEPLTPPAEENVIRRLTSFSGVGTGEVGRTDRDVENADGSAGEECIVVEDDATKRHREEQPGAVGSIKTGVRFSVGDASCSTVLEKGDDADGGGGRGAFRWPAGGVTENVTLKNVNPEAAPAEPSTSGSNTCADAVQNIHTRRNRETWHGRDRQPNPRDHVLRLPSSTTGSKARADETARHFDTSALATIPDSITVDFDEGSIDDDVFLPESLETDRASAVVEVEANELVRFEKRPEPEGAVMTSDETCIDMTSLKLRRLPRLRIHRTCSCDEVPSSQRRLTLAVSPHESSTPGYARVRLFQDRVLPEDRPWWVEKFSERCVEDGQCYLSSKKARSVMEDMFHSLPINVERNQQDMAVVDSCLADYRGVPKYAKEVTARGPAVTLRLTQTDDRRFAHLRCWQKSIGRCNFNICYWACVCCSVLLLMPFFIWICLTGGSWPVRKCVGGACCSIYYVVTLLMPMLLVLPLVLVVLAVWPDGKDEETVYIWAMLGYTVLSACCGSVFVCVTQCFFKLPTIFYGDFVTALVCPIWPDDARDFVTRPRHWPSHDDIERVVQRGCHLVPKPPAICPCNDGLAPCEEAHLLWRYSFSQAELTLSKSIPEHYRRAYIALKWLVRRYVMKAADSQDGDHQGFMRSYYLKAVLFWELDQTEAVAPSLNAEETVLRRLAERLQRHLIQRHLPHFFIPSVNLFDELTEEDYRRSLELMVKVIDNPAPLINLPELKVSFYSIAFCETLFCKPGRDYRGDLCCNYASRLHTVW